MTHTTTLACIGMNKSIRARVTNIFRLLVVTLGTMAMGFITAAFDQDWPLLGRNADMQHNTVRQLINDKNVGNLSDRDADERWVHR